MTAKSPALRARYEGRREEIIDRAAALFAENGYAATGVTELGQAVGLGRGALYYYIESKENLLVTIQDRVLAPLLSQAGAIAAVDARPIVRLRLLSEALLTIIMTRIDHIRVYQHDYVHLTGENRVRFLEQRRQFESVVRGLLQEAIDDGSLRDMDPRLAAYQFLNLHNHTYQWARASGHRWSVQELSYEYCRTLFDGMARGGAGINDIESETILARTTGSSAVPA